MAKESIFTCDHCGESLEGLGIKVTVKPFRNDGGWSDPHLIEGLDFGMQENRQTRHYHPGECYQKGLAAYAAGD